MPPRQKPTTPAPPWTSGSSSRAWSAATQSATPCGKSNFGIIPSEASTPSGVWSDSQLGWMRQKTSGAPTT